MLSHPNYSLATHLPQLQDLLCCYFWRYQARAGWVGVFWPQTVALLLPPFQATVTLLDPTEAGSEG